jgi:hypothetical protein
MARDDLGGIPDGGTLRRLASGLEIVRRRKHEPIDLDSIAQRERERLTDKRFGSKFLADWNLVQLTDWITEEVESRGWAMGASQLADVHFDDPVGVVSGEPGLTIRIISDGRYVHAFPV